MRVAWAVIIESLPGANRYYVPQKSGLRFFSNTDGWKTKIEQKIEGGFLLNLPVKRVLFKKR